MIQNKIVVHYLNARMEKGITNDFFPNKDFFHIVPVGTQPGSKPLDVKIPELKAVFFVRQFDGNPDYIDKKEFESGKPMIVGRKIKVVFNDGEIMIGTTNGYQPDRPGFLFHRLMQNPM